MLHQLDPMPMPSLPRIRGVDAKAVFMKLGRFCRGSEAETVGKAWENREMMKSKHQHNSGGGIGFSLEFFQKSTHWVKNLAVSNDAFFPLSAHIV